MIVITVTGENFIDLGCEIFERRKYEDDLIDYLKSLGISESEAGTILEDYVDKISKVIAEEALIVGLTLGRLSKDCAADVKTQ